VSKNVFYKHPSLGPRPLITVLDSIISDRYARTMFFYCVPLHQCHGSSSFCCRSGSGSNFHFDPDQDPDPDTPSFTHVGNSEEIFSGNKYSIVKLYIWLKLIWIRQKDADPDLHYSCFDGQAGRSDG